MVILHYYLHGNQNNKLQIFALREKSYKPLYLTLLLITTMLLIIGFLYKADMTQWWKAHYQQEESATIATALPAEKVTAAQQNSDETLSEKAVRQ